MEVGGFGFWYTEIMKLKLVLPSTEYKDSYLKALEEYHQEERYLDFNLDKLQADFSSFVTLLKGFAKGLNLPEGFIPETKFWLVDGDKFIGNASIRHYLTKELNRFGGHIGYDIRPTERGKGYGKIILNLALDKAKDLGIKKALITCDVGNIASKKVIESNGGVLENIVDMGEGNPKKRRYLINL